MAAKQCESSSSLTAELLQKISPMPYKTYVAKINEGDAVTPENFKNSRSANYFTVDSSNIVKNGQANPNHIFDLFGTFSGHSGTEVRVNPLKNIASDMDFYKRRSVVCLQMRSISFEPWIETITDESVYCNELALMGLCYMYHRHCVVLTQNKLWSTVQADTPLNLLDLLKECSVHLIYLGNLCFGVLTWQPRLTKKVATKSPGFNIIEEYTLDEQNAQTGAKQEAIKPVVKPDTAGNVETSAMDHTNIPMTGKHVQSTSSTVCVEMSDNQQDSLVLSNDKADATLHMVTKKGGHCLNIIWCRYQCRTIAGYGKHNQPRSRLTCRNKSNLPRGWHHLKPFPVESTVKHRH